LKSPKTNKSLNLRCSQASSCGNKAHTLISSLQQTQKQTKLPALASQVSYYANLRLFRAFSVFSVQLWITEAKRRRDEVRAGTVDTVPGEEALRQVRDSIRR